MAKLGRDEIERIIERDIPGAKVLHTRTVGDFGLPEVSADSVTPDVDALRSKFLGADAPVRMSDDTLQAVAITYDEADDSPGSARTAIVSVNEGKVVGAQG